MHIKNDLKLGNVFLNKRKDIKINSFDLIIANQDDVLLFINLIKPYIRFKNKQLEIAKIILEKILLVKQ